jgi:hypothetical protein
MVLLLAFGRRGTGCFVQQSLLLCGRSALKTVTNTDKIVGSGLPFKPPCLSTLSSQNASTGTDEKELKQRINEKGNEIRQLKAYERAEGTHGG